jgi:hypothetical protein
MSLSDEKSCSVILLRRKSRRQGLGVPVTLFRNLLKTPAMCIQKSYVFRLGTFQFRLGGFFTGRKACQILSPLTVFPMHLVVFVVN